MNESRGVRTRDEWLYSHCVCYFDVGISWPKMDDGSCHTDNDDVCVFRPPPASSNSIRDLSTSTARQRFRPDPSCDLGNARGDSADINTPEPPQLAAKQSVRFSSSKS
jgi:hypothetical protein